MFCIIIDEDGSGFYNLFYWCYLLC